MRDHSSLPQGLLDVTRMCSRKRKKKAGRKHVCWHCGARGRYASREAGVLRKLKKIEEVGSGPPYWERPMSRWRAESLELPCGGLGGWAVQGGISNSIVKRGLARPGSGGCEGRKYDLTALGKYGVEWF